MTRRTQLGVLMLVVSCGGAMGTGGLDGGAAGSDGGADGGADGARALREAKLRLPNACIEDIDYAAKRELDRALVRQLGTCAWVGSHANLIITGATGTGKSYVACALAQQACRTGHRASYRRMPRLLEELALAHADGTYTRLLGRLAKIDVLVLDDWGLAPLREQERRDMLEIFEDRHGSRSTIVTSQLPVETWHVLSDNYISPTATIRSPRPAEA